MKKGQAAMEFLMTYGWAILVVLIVIAALAYFGILDPANVLPEKCTFPVDFTCTDHLVSGDTINVRLVNNAGRDIQITDAAAASIAVSGACDNVAAGTGQLGAGGEVTITLDNCAPVAGTTGSRKNRYDVNVTYNVVGSSLNHVVQGEILAARSG